MNSKAVIALISCAVCLSACGDSREHLNNIEAPKTGGLITKLGDDFAVVVRDSDGTIKRTTAELIERVDTKIIKSFETLFTFNVDGCGYLKFIETSKLGAKLMPVSADDAHQEITCIINGGVENNWKINA
tara:strand:- start:930 stop:1319 length:390 start_codon:yes stop_codon:yes gene_type:complete